MVYDYVLAAHSGQVVKAGWMRENDRRYGLGLMVEIQATTNNGMYKSRYGHLSALTVQTNQPVIQQKVIGISGKTGSVRGEHGLHLHFEVQKRHAYDNLFYPMNPYGWLSADPDPWQNANVPGGRPASINLWQNAPAIGFTGGCPQKMYESGTPLLPSNDPPLVPDLTNPVRRVIDDKDVRFSHDAPWVYVSNCMGGCYGGTYWWLSGTGNYTIYSATWQLYIHDLAVGEYDMYAYIPNAHANSILAYYKIYHNSKVHGAGIDQSRFNKPGYPRTWAYLGRYDFSDGMATLQPQRIVIYHNGDVGQDVAADAIALVLADGPPDLNLPIAVGSDDAGRNASADCGFSTAHNEIYLGRCANGTDVVSGFHYDNVAIPANAIVTRAHLHFTVDGTYTQTLRLRFYGDPDPESLTFNDDNKPEDRSLTNAWSYWYVPTADKWEYPINPYLPLQTRYSPNLGPVVQEIVNHSNWLPGKSLTFIVKPAPDFSGNVYRRVMAYERIGAPPGTYAARLLVWFDE
ncbi:MAG: peptidoglycan DD-metalloendopeptidase family protein [Anaerolineae bacterium]|nr:peptidoglycan DD-metalloendopeptidase family protein [Anaerolineae bacterium]